MVQHSVLLVEDDDNTRARLERLVNDHSQLTVVASVATCAEARNQLEKVFPSVLLVDLGLPDGNGVELIREVKQANPATEAMVITVLSDERHVVAAIEAGASGYLLKDGSSEYIGQSIMQLIDGGSPISAAIARHLLKRFQPSDAVAKIEKELFTGREREVLELVAKGFSYAEIADVLVMSVHTVTTHIKHIYRKLAVRSRGEAVFEALQRGLIDPPA